MSIQPITMPKWGMSMNEGKLVGWLVQEGDVIQPGTELLEIETDKITNVLEAQIAGVLRRKVAAEGDVLPITALLGVMADPSVSEGDIDAFVEANRTETGAGDVDADRTRTIDVGGRIINLMDSGGDDTDAFLMLHGFGGDLSNWLFNFSELSEHLRTVALDLPGHGKSSKDVRDGSIEGMVDVVAEVIDTLGLHRVHLIGHSMGGKVAASLALARPDVVASLTLLAPAGFEIPVNSEFVTAFVQANDRKEMKRVLGMLFSDPDVVTREMVNDVLQYKRIDGVPEALSILQDKALAPGSDVSTESVAALDKPTILFWGADDRVIPAPANGLSALEVRVLPGKGHMLHMEAVAEVNAAILAVREASQN